MGNLINAYPGTFYCFEPLIKLDEVKATRFIDDEKAITRVSNIFKCQPGQDYLDTIDKKDHWGRFLLKDNLRFRDACRMTSNNTVIRNDMCYKEQAFKELCSLFPIRLIKVLRMRPSAVEKLLLNPSLNASLKVIYLFRDPICVMNSRKNLRWCKPKRCSNVDIVCKDMTTDMVGAYKLTRQYPGIRFGCCSATGRHCDVTKSNGFSSTPVFAFPPKSVDK